MTEVPRNPLQVLTIPEAARLIGWRRHRMARLLHRANERLGGTLLFDTSQGLSRPRWSVSVAGLKQLAPQWFTDQEAMQAELELVRQQTEALEDAGDEIRDAIRLLSAKVDALLRRR